VLWRSIPIARFVAASDCTGHWTIRRSAPQGLGPRWQRAFSRCRRPRPLPRPSRPNRQASMRARPHRKIPARQETHRNPQTSTRAAHRSSYRSRSGQRIQGPSPRSSSRWSPNPRPTRVSRLSRRPRWTPPPRRQPSQLSSRRHRISPSQRRPRCSHRQAPNRYCPRRHRQLSLCRSTSGLRQRQRIAGASSEAPATLKTSSPGDRLAPPSPQSLRPTPP
jgi:hypothetical protein